MSNFAAQADSPLSVFGGWRKVQTAQSTVPRANVGATEGILR